MRGALLLMMLAAAGVVQAQDDRFPLPPKEWASPVADEEPFAYLVLDRFEYRAQKGADARMWDGQAWFGGDYNRLWLKSEGQQSVGGGTEEADLLALYARRIAPFWFLQTGVRSELRPGPAQNYGVLAIQGTAPYWFNVEASAFFRGGQISGRLELEYDQLLTQRLILQPRIETNFSAAADPARGAGRGIREVEIGLRLRYEIVREFAPYIGVNWTRKMGGTADIARGAGEDASVVSIVAGVRLWY